MRLYRKIGFIFLLALLVSHSVHSADQNEDKKSKNNQSEEISFDEILIQGQYHFSDEKVNTVGGKILDSLLEVPKDFRDRIKKSSERN